MSSAANSTSAPGRRRPDFWRRCSPSIPARVGPRRGRLALNTPRRAACSICTAAMPSPRSATAIRAGRTRSASRRARATSRAMRCRMRHPRARGGAAGPLLEAGLHSVFFVNSGAEANENALKMAFRMTRPPARRGDRRRLPRPHGCRRRAHLGRRRSGTAFRARRSMSASCRAATSPAIAAHVTERTAAVIVEPVQGVGGAVDLGEPYLRGLAPPLRRGRRAADLR